MLYGRRTRPVRLEGTLIQTREQHARWMLNPLLSARATIIVRSVLAVPIAK